MEKQKIKAKIEKYKARIEKLELELKRPEVNRFEFEKPREKEMYYYMVEGGQSLTTWCSPSLSDNERWELGNCFSSDELCGKAIEKQKAVMQLKRIAHRLNNGVEIDWGDELQAKWLIYYNHSQKAFTSTLDWITQDSNITCSNSNFLSVALEEMGEEKLKLALGVE